MEHLKPLLPASGDASELEAAAQALAGLSLEDRDLLAAVQESPYRLTLSLIHIYVYKRQAHRGSTIFPLRYPTPSPAIWCSSWGPTIQPAYLM